MALPEENDYDNDHQKNKSTQGPYGNEGSNFHASVVFEGGRPIVVGSVFQIDSQWIEDAFKVDGLPDTLVGAHSHGLVCVVVAVLVMDHPVSWLAKVHRQTKPRRRGPVGQSVVSVGHLGRLTAADGFALRLSACPNAILSTEPGGISPQYVARIAMVGSH